MDTTPQKRLATARRQAIIASLPLLFLVSVKAYGDSEEEALTRAFGDETFITIATGSKQPISQAPAVASVITAEDIKAIGATDLDQVLETVPGLHVSNSPRAYGPLYTMRGIYSENNPQILVLINDIPITNVYVGDRGQVWGGMPVNDIARIEIIRGPGSAIYGADAFAGTINIITKTASDINGTEAGARIGSYNTREGWVLHGGTIGGFDVAFSLEASATDGYDGIIEKDAQSGFDSLFGTNASLAPGQLNLQRKDIDTRLDISRGEWRLRLGYQGRRDVGTGAGVGDALDPEGNNKSKRINADLTYNTILSQNWDVTGQLSYLDTSAESDLILYPPGAVIGGPFPNGVVGSPYVYERHTRGGLSAFYYGFEQHKIRLGAGAVNDDMYRIREFKNFYPDLSPFPQGTVETTDDLSNVFIQPHDRTIFYTFVQDQWDLATDWTLTGGIRYDHYSDFGDTTNPRLALVWQMTPKVTTKFLYGRAFRAPAFNELYNTNNPAALGNPNLKPETIDTYEVAFDHRYSSRMQYGLNLFYYRIEDTLRIPPNSSTTENVGSITGRGLELEAAYDMTSNFKISGNYAYQLSRDEDSGSDVANAPQHQIYLRGVWTFFKPWSLTSQLKWVADRKRDPNDPRAPIDDYVLVDTTLRYQAESSPWEFALSVHNIFNADAREPSPRLFPDTLPVIGGQPMIPNDLPLPDRNYFVEARYRF